MPGMATMKPPKAAASVIQKKLLKLRVSIGLTNRVSSNDFFIISRRVDSDA
jgi:hypothetical protein